MDWSLGGKVRGHGSARIGRGIAKGVRVRRCPDRVLDLDIRAPIGGRRVRWTRGPIGGLGCDVAERDQVEASIAQSSSAWAA